MSDQLALGFPVEIEQHLPTIFSGMPVSKEPLLTVADRMDIWRKMLALWLADFKSENTRRNYLDAIGEFLARDTYAFLHDTGRRISAILYDCCNYQHAPGLRPLVPPWEVSKYHVGLWLIELNQRIIESGPRAGKALSDRTISLKISAVASFYKFANCYTYPVDGVPYQPYTAVNPCNGVKRQKIKVKFKRGWLTTVQINDIISRIPDDTINGLMHRALLMTYAATGRRNSEVRLMQWKHFTEMEDGSIQYVYYGKNVGDRDKEEDGETQELHADCWRAIELYLRADGRWGKMHPDDYLFIAHSDKATRFKKLGADYVPGENPIGRHEPVRIIKQYAAAAGYDPAKIGIHVLRHSMQHALKSAGASLEYRQHRLGHKSPATTQIYDEIEFIQIEEPDRLMMDMFKFDKMNERAARKMGLEK